MLNRTYLSVTILAVSLSPLAAIAQSGGGGYQAAPSQQAPVTAPAMASSDTAMGGYCAVCLTNRKQWMKGSPQHTVSYDGKAYLFPGGEQQAMFQANPAQFVPALGGDDVVAFAQNGQRVAGRLENGISYDGRFYFFASEASKQAFQASPTQYANADVAIGGQCAVCIVDYNDTVIGKPEFTAHYQGLRYLFPEESARAMFVSNPAKYANAKPSDVSAPQPPAGTGSGSR